ncbi:hypothetical protein V6N13_005119 [Hibiscus sabdariffa]
MVMEAEWEKFGSTSSVSPRLDPNRSTESHIRAPNIDVQAVNDEIFVRENYPLEFHATFVINNRVVYPFLFFLLSLKLFNRVCSLVPSSGRNQGGYHFQVLCCCMSQVSSVFHRFL